MTFGFTLAVCLIGPRIPNWIDSGDRPGHRGFGHSLFSLILFTNCSTTRIQPARRSGPCVALRCSPRGRVPLSSGAGLRDLRGSPLVLAPWREVLFRSRLGWGFTRRLPGVFGFGLVDLSSTRPSLSGCCPPLLSRVTDDYLLGVNPQPLELFRIPSHHLSLKDHNALIPLFRPREAEATGDNNFVVYHGETIT